MDRIKKGNLCIPMLIAASSGGRSQIEQDSRGKCPLSTTLKEKSSLHPHQPNAVQLPDDPESLHVTGKTKTTEENGADDKKYPDGEKRPRALRGNLTLRVQCSVYARRSRIRHTCRRYKRCAIYCDLSTHHIIWVCGAIHAAHTWTCRATNQATTKRGRSQWSDATGTDSEPKAAIDTTTTIDIVERIMRRRQPTRVDPDG